MRIRDRSKPPDPSTVPAFMVVVKSRSIYDGRVSYGFEWAALVGPAKESIYGPSRRRGPGFGQGERGVAGADPGSTGPRMRGPRRRALR